jgi:putative flippase GtrA
LFPNRDIPAEPNHSGLNPRLFVRFGLVGLLNAGFGYAVFALLIREGIWPSVALIAAAVAGTIFNFQTSQRLVFRSRGDAVRFVGVYVVVLAVNWSALFALRRCGLPDLESQGFLTLPIAALSFLGQRRFVFGRPSEAR